MDKDKMNKIINALECCINGSLCAECDYEGIPRCFDKVLLSDAIAMLKEQEAITNELKLKMWNALYAKEDEYEKKLVGTDKHYEWFSIYRPWLQIGFSIAIDAIADWEGRRSE